MTAPSHPPRSDDEAWFEGLAGRASRGPAAREGARLRAAYGRLPAPVVATPPVEPIVAAARAEGLFRRRGLCPSCAQRWRRWTAALRANGWRWSSGLAVAAVLAGVSASLWMQPGPEPAPTLRAPADGLWLRAAPDPAAARDRLAERLQAQGLTVRRYERLGRAGLDADLPQPPSAELQRLLREEGLVPAADGSLRVEFERR